MRVLHEDLLRGLGRNGVNIASFEVPSGSRPLKAVVEDGAIRVYYAVSDKRSGDTSRLEVCVTPEGTHIPEEFSVLNDIRIEGGLYWLSVSEVMPKTDEPTSDYDSLVFLVGEYAREMSCDPDCLSEGEKSALAYAVGRLRGGR